MNPNNEAMQLLVNAFVLILCRKVPAEVPVKKLDQLYEKVKLITKPDEEKEEKETKAVIRLTINKQKPKEPEEGEPPVQKASAMVEIDQEGKGIAMNGRSETLPYVVEVINTYPARLVREDFLDHIVKQLPAYFKEHDTASKDIMKQAEKNCADSEHKYIEAKCGEFIAPLFDYHVDVHQYE